MQLQTKRPGFLTKYAAHAGVSVRAAAEQLKRVGIDYMQPFDHAEADKRRLAARRADRAPYAKPIYLDPAQPGEDQDDDSGADGVKDPAFAKSQAQKEYFRAELARLDFEERIGKLVEKEKVDEIAFSVARLVRDAMLNIPSRIAGILAAESDQWKVHDLLEEEIHQALEALATYELGGTDHG